MSEVTGDAQFASGHKVWLESIDMTGDGSGANPLIHCKEQKPHTRPRAPGAFVMVRNASKSAPIVPRLYATAQNLLRPTVILRL